MNQRKENLIGLTNEEVVKLEKEYGKNEITSSKKDTLIIKILHSLCEPMFLLLIIASSIYFLLGEPQDGIIMLIFVIVVMSIDMFQEWKTDKTLSALKKLSTPHITVLRDNKKIEISSIDLLPGDIMYIHEGIKIPADGYIIKSNNLKVDESLLTGESLPVHKTSKEYKGEDYWRQDYCYQGTLVISGTATIKVEHIGINTEYGKIGSSLKQIEERKTPLQIQVDSLVKVCSIIALILFILVALFTFISIPTEPIKSRIISSILSGITLAMAMIPEEFPVVLTVFLGVGAWRLAKKKSLVKKLSSVETLGSISVLCVDKTGTITKNEMTITDIKTNIDKNTVINNAILCSEENPYDPMEKSILKYAKEHKTTNNYTSSKKIKEYPFTDEHKMMASAWNINNKIIISAKGSPESIIEICNIPNDELEKVNKELSIMQSSGLRVIAVASKEYPENTSLEENILSLKLTFLGLIGFIDPPKDNIANYISSCNKAGIRVVMITGDNGLTAASIAEKIGIPSKKVINGSMIDKMTKEELANSVKDCSIFSRVLPEHKKKIIESYQQNGYIVAMTGDGVNDATALKQADIGISMGSVGSEVSSASADLILLDDNFNTIISTIKDGRRIYDNIKKSINYILTIHIPIALSTLASSILGVPSNNLMLLPLHIVLLELIIDPTCSIIFEREPAEPNIMDKPPRNINESLLTKSNLIKSILEGLIIFISSFITYYLLLDKDPILARTMSFNIIILSNIFLVQVNASNTNYAYQTIKSLIKDKVIVLIHIIIITSILIINYTSIHHILKLTSLNIKELTITVLISFLSVYWYEIVKFIKNNYQKQV